MTYVYKQLAELTNRNVDDFKIGYDNWKKETGLTDEEANRELFSLPEMAAIALLEIHMK